MTAYCLAGDQPDRKPGSGVPGPLARIVNLQTPVQIVRATAIEGAVRTDQKIDEPDHLL